MKPTRMKYSKGALSHNRAVKKDKGRLVMGKERRFGIGMC